MRRYAVVAVVVGSLASVLAAETSSAQLAPTTNGLVMPYQFENDTGTSARDTSPSVNNATYVNTTAAAATNTGPAGKGKAIKLVGAQRQYLAVPERNVLDVNRYTLAAYVRYTGVQNPQTFGRWE